MARVSPLQSNFSGGEISPLYYGRSDDPRYGACLKKCLRYIPSLQGNLTRCPGTYYVASTKTASKKARLIAFEYSITQAYIIEAGDQYMRFYMNNGQLLRGGVPY